LALFVPSKLFIAINVATNHHPLPSQSVTYGHCFLVP